MTIGRPLTSPPDVDEGVDLDTFAWRLEASPAFLDEWLAECPDVPLHERAMAALESVIDQSQRATRFGGSRRLAEWEACENLCRAYERDDAMFREEREAA